MSAFGKRFNRDDIAERNAIAGILNVLHEELKFEYVHSENDVEEVSIPFYYSLSGDERFLMDNFLNEFDTTQAETQYDKVPRGVLFIESSAIATEGLTNPHLRLPEVVEEFENAHDEFPEMKTYYTVFTSVPIQMNMTCRIKVATHRDLLIISQILKQEFFRNKRFHYDFRGIPVPGNISFPDSIDKENPIEYTYGDDRNQELLLALEIETYLPAYNKDTRIPAANRMAYIDNTVFPKSNLNK